jgi:demethylmenaquinone methyltransferase/2-methoxy-6-polyprenyl-1,4-benzoquinol methylase
LKIYPASAVFLEKLKQRIFKMNLPKGYPLNEFYSRIYKRYDLINRLFTLGNDQKWRKIASDICLKNHPKKVLDLCCGTGDLAISLYKKSHGTIEVIGCDFNLNMLGKAEYKAKKLKLKKIKFIQGDAAELPFSDGHFNAVTIGFGIRNLTFENPKSSVYLMEINRVLKKEGRLIILESSVPENKFVKFFYEIYLNYILIPMGGLISGTWDAYRYLAHSSSNYFNFGLLKEILEKEEFTLLNHRKFLFGATNIVVFIKK